MFGGLDLAAKDTNKTGICLIDDNIEIYTVREDDQIINLLKDAKVIAVDAPLTSKKVTFRSAEREIMKDFGPMLPINMSGMRLLAERALRLKKILEVELIETFPRAVEKNLNIDMDGLAIEFNNGHEYDAYLCALAAESYYHERYLTDL